MPADGILYWLQLTYLLTNIPGLNVVSDVLKLSMLSTLKLSSHVFQIKKLGGEFLKDLQLS